MQPLALGWLKGGAHQYGHAAHRQAIDLCRLDHALDVGGAADRRAATEQMIQCQHAVGLAATESGFQLNDWFAILTAHPADGLYQQALHSLGDVGAREKLNRIAVLIRAFAARHLRKVSCKFSILVAALRHIGMRFDDVSPTEQALDRCALHDAQRLFARSGI